MKVIDITGNGQSAAEPQKVYKNKLVYIQKWKTNYINSLLNDTRLLINCLKRPEGSTTRQSILRIFKIYGKMSMSTRVRNC